MGFFLELFFGDSNGRPESPDVSPSAARANPVLMYVWGHTRGFLREGVPEIEEELVVEVGRVASRVAEEAAAKFRRFAASA